MGKITDGIARGINGFTSPEALTTQFIKNICLSDYTLETIRGLLINPIRSKFVPKEESFDEEAMEHNFFALCNMIGYEKICTDILSITDKEKIGEIEVG